MDFYLSTQLIQNTTIYHNENKIICRNYSTSGDAH